VKLEKKIKTKINNFTFYLYSCCFFIFFVLAKISLYIHIEGEKKAHVYVFCEKKNESSVFFGCFLCILFSLFFSSSSLLTKTFELLISFDKHDCKQIDVWGKLGFDFMSDKHVCLTHWMFQTIHQVASPSACFRKITRKTVCE
jgi:hypothetical protein